MKYEVIIFDLDGTLLNTLADHTKAVNYIMKKYNYPLVEKEKVRQVLGNGLVNTISKLLPKEAFCEHDEIISEFIKYYQENANVYTKPYVGVKKMLNELKKAGYVLCLCSNKRYNAVNLLNQIYFADLFSLVVGENEAAGIKKKPSSDMIDLIINKLMVPRNKVIYVGDSEVDYATSVAAKINCILVTWGFRDKDFLKKYTNNLIDEPKEICSIIDKL